MSHLGPGITPRLRRSCGAAAVAVVLALATGAGVAHAAIARVTWLPVVNALSYSIYVRNAGAAYGLPSPLGNLTTNADGSMSATVNYTAYATGNYFAATARNSDGTESALSAERSLGPINRCRIDQCFGLTTCQFGTHANGAACDDQSFCNGHETCQNGTCTTGAPPDCADSVACSIDSCSDALQRCVHQSPPGCCLACDSGDPCLAEACANGECSAEPFAELVVQRMKMQTKAAGIKLAVKAVFIPPAPLDPTTSGATIEMRAPDGAVLYSAHMSSWRFQEGIGGRYRFAVSRREATDFSGGISRLDFRIKQDEWHVTIKGETPLLAAAVQEAALTLVIRFGESCIRDRDLPCLARNDYLTICRD